MYIENWFLGLILIIMATAFLSFAIVYTYEVQKGKMFFEKDFKKYGRK